MATADDINSTLQNIVQQLGQWVKAYNNRVVFGTFTMTAATTTVVTQPAVASNSFIGITPTNGTAALTVRTAGWFVSARTPGASFSISTQSGQAAGTETFTYIVLSPS